MIKTTCYICGAVFETARANRKYCSLSCQAAGKKLQRMKWEQKNPQYFADRMRKRRAALKEKKNNE
jgi:hypothetical protein